MKFYTSKIAVERQKMEDKSSFYVSSISIKYVALSIPKQNKIVMKSRKRNPWKPFLFFHRLTIYYLSTDYLDIFKY